MNLFCTTVYKTGHNLKQVIRIELPSLRQTETRLVRTPSNNEIHIYRFSQEVGLKVTVRASK